MILVIKYKNNQRFKLMKKLYSAIFAILFVLNADAQTFQGTLLNALEQNKPSATASQETLDKLKVSIMNSFHIVISDTTYSENTTLEELIDLRKAYYKIVDSGVQDKDLFMLASQIKNITVSKYGVLLAQYQVKKYKLSKQEQNNLADFISLAIPKSDGFMMPNEGSLDEDIIKLSSGVFSKIDIKSKKLEETREKVYKMLIDFSKS
tara:strand:+ start:227 stop:847 length:621 start_codon:yes stop_codon:yes gene_type:complete